MIYLIVSVIINVFLLITLFKLYKLRKKEKMSSNQKVRSILHALEIEINKMKNKYED